MVPPTTVALDIARRNVPYGLPPPSMGPPVSPGLVQHNTFGGATGRAHKASAGPGAPTNCTDGGGYRVAGAGDASCNGCYLPAGNGSYVLTPAAAPTPDDRHSSYRGAGAEGYGVGALSLYAEQGVWRIGVHGRNPLLYVATAASPTPLQSRLFAG